MLRVLPSTFNPVTKNLICCKTALMWVENPQHRYSTSFAAMLPNKLHVFCCPFFRTFRNTSRVTISSRLNWPTMSITRVLYSQLTWYNSIWLWGWLPCRYCCGIVSHCQSTVDNSPSQDYAHSDDHAQPTYEMTPWLKPFTKKSYSYCSFYCI